MKKIMSLALCAVLLFTSMADARHFGFVGGHGGVFVGGVRGGFFGVGFRRNFVAVVPPIVAVNPPVGVVGGGFHRVGIAGGVGYAGGYSSNVGFAGNPGAAYERGVGDPGATYGTHYGAASCGAVNVNPPATQARVVNETVEVPVTRTRVTETETSTQSVVRQRLIYGP